MLRPALILVRSGKQDFYALPAAAPQVGGAATPGDHPLLHLLPLYDEYVMGYKDRSCIWLQENGFRPATALRYPNLIIFNGQVIGSWRRTLHPRAIDLEHHFLTPPTPVQLASFEKAVDRFALFNGLPVTRLVE